MMRFIAFMVIMSIFSAISADEASIEKGKVLLDKGSYDVAIKTLEEAVDAKKSDLGVEYLINAYRLTGKYSKALDLADIYSKSKKNSARALMLKGEILQGLGKYEEAYENLMSAYILDEASIRIQVSLGLYYMTVGQKSKYVALFSGVFDNYYPDEEYSSEDLLYIAIACRYYALNTNEVERSDTLKTIINSILSDQEYKNGAIEKDPYNFAAYIQMIEMFTSAFNTVDAKSTVREALELNPHHPDLLYAQAMAFSQDYAKKPDVIPTLEHGLGINPNHVNSLVLAGAMYLLDEEYDRSYDSFQKASKINPNDLQCLSWLAAYHYLRHETSDYEKYKKKVLDINSGYGSFFYIVGQAAASKFQFKACVDLNQKAVDVDPFLWEGYIELGASLMRMGEEEKAKEYFEKVQNEYNFHVQTHNMLLLLSKYKEFKTFETENFKIRLHESEADVMFPILSEYLENALTDLSKIYDFKPEGPILFELFPEQNDFSVRAVGLSMLPASGVCFGKVVAQISPRAVKLNTMNWASVAWHEFTHVFTLQITDFNIPRWFTEGLSEMSERNRNPAVLRKHDNDLLTAYNAGLMRGIKDLNAGFTRPRYGLEVVVCYYQAGLICHYINTTFGFNSIKKMLSLYKEGKKDSEVIKEALGIEPEEFDKHFEKWLHENIFGKMKVLPPIPAKKIDDLKDQTVEDPENIKAFGELAIAYLQANRLRDAEINAGYLLALDPINTVGYDVLGRVFYYRKNMEQAVKFLEQAISLGSENFYTYLILGIIAYNGKDLNRAETYLKQAKSSYPSFVGQNNPYILLANIYKASHKRKKYLAEIEEYLGKEGDNFPLRLEIAEEYIQKNKFKTAAKWLDEAQDIYPFDLNLQLKRGDIFTKLKDFKNAIVAYEIALALKPKEGIVEIHVNLAELYFGSIKGNIVNDANRSKAKEHAENALKIDSGNEKAKQILQKIK